MPTAAWNMQAFWYKSPNWPDQYGPKIVVGPEEAEWCGVVSRWCTFLPTRSNPMTRWVTLAFLFTAFVTACTPTIKYTPGKNLSDLQSRNVPDGENILPSGRTIFVNNTTKMDFPNGPSALVLNYSTSASIDDMKALRAEVDEIWPIFVKDVETANLRGAALRPVNGPNGHGFVFLKRDDGTWYCTQDEKK
jgi:hypothetical protein